MFSVSFCSVFKVSILTSMAPFNPWGWECQYSRAVTFGRARTLWHGCRLLPKTFPRNRVSVQVALAGRSLDGQSERMLNTARRPYNNNCCEKKDKEDRPCCGSRNSNSNQQTAVANTAWQANTTRWLNAGLMLAHRRRRSANIGPALGQRVEFCWVVRADYIAHVCKPIQKKKVV